MPLNFPTSPVLNQLYNFNSKTWRWDGAGWVSYNVGLIGPSGSTGSTGAIGPTGAIPTDYVISFNGSTGTITFVNYVSSLNGATGVITNVARINEGNTFSVLQVMNAGFTSAGGNFTKGITFSSIGGNTILFNDTSYLGVTLLHSSPFVASLGRALTIKSEETTALIADPASIQIIGGDQDNIFGSIKLNASEIYSTGYFVNPSLSSPSVIGNITLPLGEIIRNTTNGSIDLMPDGSNSSHYGMRVDATSWGFGTRLYSVRASDGNITVGSFLFMNGCILNSDIDFGFNSSNSSRIRHSSTGNDTLQIIITNDASNSGSVAIVNQATVGSANRSPTTNHTNPNFYVYSADGTNANDFIRFEHDQTNANIVSGDGAINIKPANSIVNIIGGITASGATFTGAVSSDGGYRITSNAINSQTGTTYTFLESDNGKIITFNNNSSITVTVPTALPVGFNCTAIQLGTGQVGFTAATGVTMQSYGNQYKLIGQHASATIIEYATNIVNLSGNLII